MENKTVLFVDDDGLATQFYRKALEKAQYTVEHLESADDGRIRLEENPKDKPVSLVVLDIMMAPGTFMENNLQGLRTGINLLGWIRSKSHWKDVPVIVLTNIADEGTLQEAQSYPKVEVKKKALTLPSQLMESVKSLIGPAQ